MAEPLSVVLQWLKTEQLFPGIYVHGDPDDNVDEMIQTQGFRVLHRTLQVNALKNKWLLFAFICKKSLPEQIM